MSKIKEDANDEAHIQDGAPLVLKFKHANDDHIEMMVGKELKDGEG
jgi:hypothetical protein